MASKKCAIKAKVVAFFWRPSAHIYDRKRKNHPRHSRDGPQFINQSMPMVVSTSEEDPVLPVFLFTDELSWADACPEVAELQVTRLCVEAHEYMVDGRWLDLLSLKRTSADLIFSIAFEKDLERVFTFICDLVKKTKISRRLVLMMADLISSKVVQRSSDKPVLRLKILFNLYNLLEDPYSKFVVYRKALNLALHGEATEHVIPSFKNIDSFQKEWNLAVKDQRELFFTILRILREHKSNSKDFFKFLSKYLVTFSTEDVDKLNEAKEEAVLAIVEFIKSPDMFQCDLLSIPAVVQLEADAIHAPVYQLLKIFLTQRLGEYLEFHAANSDLLKSLGLTHEDCISKMRLMPPVDFIPNSKPKPFTQEISITRDKSVGFVPPPEKPTLEELRWRDLFTQNDCLRIWLNKMKEGAITDRALQVAFIKHSAPDFDISKYAQYPEAPFEFPPFQHPFPFGPPQKELFVHSNETSESDLRVDRSAATPNDVDMPAGDDRIDTIGTEEGEAGVISTTHMDGTSTSGLRAIPCTSDLSSYSLSTLVTISQLG